MSLGLRQLLPEYEEQTKNVQARIPASLFAKADKIRRKNKWSWPEVFAALLEKFHHEFAEKPKPQESFQFRKPVLDEANKSSWK